MPARLWELPTLLLSLVGARSHRVVLESFGSVRTRNDYAILAGLEQFGPLNQAELARRVGFDRSDLVPLIRDLEHRGLASRCLDPDDRRRNSVSITDDGGHLLRNLDGAAAKAQETLLSSLSAAQRQNLTEVLQHLLGHHSGN